MPIKKVEKIVVLNFQSDFLEKSNYSNLKNLINKATEWVRKEKAEIAGSIIFELEKLDHADLISMEPMSSKRFSTDYLETHKKALP